VGGIERGSDRKGRGGWRSQQRAAAAAAAAALVSEGCCCMAGQTDVSHQHKHGVASQPSS